jgi:cytochrome c556
MRLPVAVGIAALALVSVALRATAPAAPPAQESRRSQFMRQKLEYSKGLLEGLSLENYGLVETNARALRKLSEADMWDVMGMPNVEQYLGYTVEFRRICDDLNAKARARNIDGATLAYVQLTMNCVNCHKYARSVSR